MFDYAVLKVIWWVLLGVLLAGFAIMDGFDLGIAALLPTVAKTDLERRVVLNTIGPVWEGNQVWFILAGGAIFAAWPYLYAVSFSGFYLAMFLVLVTFIIRPVSFKYRSKMMSPLWRKIWDGLLCAAGFAAALVFGVAIGNVIQGVPFYFDISLRAFYLGNFWQLLNPFALLCGIISVFMLRMQGGYYLVIKTEGVVQQRARLQANIAALLMLILFLLAGIWVAYGIKGYVLLQAVNPNELANPLHKLVGVKTGAWIDNYYEYPFMLLAPLTAIIASVLAMSLSIWHQPRMALFSSSFGILGIITTVGFSLFPFILPSSFNPAASLLVWDSSSSRLTLQIMLIATIVFLPLILLYTAWVYRVLRGKVTEQYVQDNSNSVY